MYIYIQYCEYIKFYSLYIIGIIICIKLSILFIAMLTIFNSFITLYLILICIHF